MNLNDLLLTTLSTVGAPVAYQTYKGSEDTYLRFFYLPRVGFEADNEDQYHTHYVQVDIFTPYNPNNLAEETKRLMKQARFKKNFEHETFEEDTSLFHYILRFYITEEEN